MTKPPTTFTRRQVVTALGAGMACRPSTPPAFAELDHSSWGWRDWIVQGTRFISIGPHVRLQNRATGNWDILRPRVFGGDPSQAPPGRLLPNDLDAAPSQLRARMEATLDRLIASPPQPGRTRWVPMPRSLGALIASGERLTRAQLDNETLSVGVQFYIRDLSEDLVFPPPARVATVALTQVFAYHRNGLQPARWLDGPYMTVHNVPLAHATAWLMEQLDASVARVMEPFTGY